MSRSPRWGANALLIGFGLLAAALVGELGLRTYAAVNGTFAAQYRSWDPLGILVEPHGELGYRQKPNKTFRYKNRSKATSNELGYRGPEVAMPKPPGTYRVILVGGSTTHGWGVDDGETIDAYLVRRLAPHARGRTVEVVNLAFDGYDSWQVFERLRTDALPLGPDLVVVNTGVNDVRNSRFPELVDRDPRTLIWEADMARMRAEAQAGGPSLKSRIKHWSYLARFPGFARGLFYRQQTKEAVSQEGIPYPEAADYFERNLVRIDSLLAAHDVPVIYSTPPSSLREVYQPDDVRHPTYWVINAETTQVYRDTLAARMHGLVDQWATAGRPVEYVALQLSGDLFIDDCHLTPQGNQAVAEGLAELIVRRLETVSNP